MLIPLALAAVLLQPSKIVRPDCRAIYNTTLEQNGVDGRRFRRRAVNRLIAAKKRGLSIDAVEANARAIAARLSNDQDWIDWFAWNARNAYEQDCEVSK